MLQWSNAEILHDFIVFDALSNCAGSKMVPGFVTKPIEQSTGANCLRVDISGEGTTVFSFLMLLVMTS